MKTCWLEWRVDYCQSNPRRGSEDYYRKVTASIKRCRTSRQWHQEVWPGTVTTDAPGLTLAGHSQASEVQAGHPLVSARQGASVPIKLLHSSRPSRYTTASTLRCTSSADRTSTSSQHVRAAGICCRWSDDVQLSAIWSTRSRSQHSNNRWRHTFSLPSISTFSALGVFHVMRYITVRYLLIYLLEWCRMRGSKS